MPGSQTVSFVMMTLYTAQNNPQKDWKQSSVTWWVHHVLVKSLDIYTKMNLPSQPNTLTSDGVMSASARREQTIDMFSTKSLSHRWFQSFVL